MTDDDIDIRNMDEVMWAISTRADPGRDTTIIENTPIDYLDFASPQSGLGGKLGIDATSKLPAETRRDWGRVAVMSANVEARVDQLWKDLGLADKFPAN